MPVIISCAITGSIHTPSMSPHLPITPDEIAASASEAMDEQRTLAKFSRQAHQQAIDMAEGLGATLGGQTGGLVQHEQILILEDDHGFEQRAFFAR